MQDTRSTFYRSRLSEFLKRKSVLEIRVARLYQEDKLERHEIEELKAEFQAWEVEQVKLESDIDRLETLEKLERWLSKYTHFAPTETWVSRWIAAPLAYLFPKERREEWLGDLHEVNFEMLRKGYPRWMVNVVNIGRTVILLMSSLSIKISDLISLGLGRVK